MTLNRNMLLSTIFMGFLLMSPSLAKADSAQVFTSADAKENSWYTYLGGVAALSGQNLSSQDGLLLRGSVGYGKYDYDTSAVTNGNVDGTVKAGDIMVGYQHYYNTDMRISAYLGVSSENQKLSPSYQGAEVAGSERGLKGQVELQGKIMPRIPYQAIASYSTGFDTYWSQAHIGYDIGGAVVGPEIGFQGNEAYNEQRYGAILSDVNLGGATLLKVSAGLANSDRNNDSGYANIGLTKNF